MQLVEYIFKLKTNKPVHEIPKRFHQTWLRGKEGADCIRHLTAPEFLVQS